jgi:hypothetical protein
MEKLFVSLFALICACDLVLKIEQVTVAAANSEPNMRLPKGGWLETQPTTVLKKWLSDVLIMQPRSDMSMLLQLRTFVWHVMKCLMKRFDVRVTKLAL